MISNYKEKYGSWQGFSGDNMMTYQKNIQATRLQQDSEDEVYSVNRDGNSSCYQVKDLYPTEEGYNYVTNQGKIFDDCLLDLVSKYAGEYIVFENGRVIDHDIDEDILLDRVWRTEFATSRRERYHGIFCELVPDQLSA